jgi:hypothetical protein
VQARGRPSGPQRPRRRSGNGLDVEGYRSPKPLSGTCCSIATAIGGSANVCAGTTTGRVRAGSNPEGRRTDKATIQFENKVQVDLLISFCGLLSEFNGAIICTFRFISGGWAQLQWPR